MPHDYRIRIQQILHLILDAAILLLAFWAAFQMRFYFDFFLRFLPADKGIPSWNFYQDALKIVIPLWLFVFVVWGKLYSIRTGDNAERFLMLLHSVCMATLLIIAATFLYRGYQYSRAVILIASFFSLALLFLSRILIFPLLTRIFKPITHSEMILFGTDKTTQMLASNLRKVPGVHLLQFTADQKEKLIRRIQSSRHLSEVLISGTMIQNQNCDDIFDLCEDNGIEIKVVPDLLEMRLGEIMVDESLGIPVLHLKPLSLHGMRYFTKRLLDVLLAIIIVGIGFFPFVLLVLFIRLDSEGNPFFVQERVGFREKHFFCVKFRTMHKNAEELLQKLNLESFRGGPAFKMKNDPRITRIGKILRKLSLDELPQIWNILKGEMSFIGPRPQVLKEAAGNPDWAKKRYRVLPGITGLWQVSGRADLPYEEMMRLDIFYLENWSPALDFKILLKTIPVVLLRKGAY